MNFQPEGGSRSDKYSIFDKIKKDKDLKKFKYKLRINGLVIKIISSDGNCLFRSVADQLEGDPDQYKIFRKSAVEYIKSNPADFQPYVDKEDLEEYTKKLEKDGTWGG